MPSLSRPSRMGDSMTRFGKLLLCSFLSGMLQECLCLVYLMPCEAGRQVHVKFKNILAFRQQ